MTTQWYVDVTAEGIPALSDDTLERLCAIIPAAGTYNAKQGTLRLAWRLDARDVLAAMHQARRLATPVFQAAAPDSKIVEVGIRTAQWHEHQAGVAVRAFAAQAADEMDV